MTAVATEPTITVREVRASDTDWLVLQLRAFSRFFGTEKQLFTTADDVRERLPGLLAMGPCYIATNVDQLPIGFIAGLLAPHPYNPSIRVLSESFWWVDPGWRQTRAGLLLLNAFMAYGDANADWIHFTLEAKSPVNERCLLKRGFVLFERAYLREVVR